MNNQIVEVCREYARLLCTKRDLATMTPADLDVMFSLLKVERVLLEMAPPGAHEYLDTIKRIMEIDQKITDPELILMRASVIASGATS
jgi:hypothetical protein